MSFPSSAEEVYLIMLLIFPGFIANSAYRKISIREKKETNFETIIWSIAFGVLTYSVIFSITGIMKLEDMIAKIYDPIFLNEIMWTPLILGVATGYIGRLFNRGNIYPKDCWILFQKKLAKRGSWVSIYTKDGKEYKGYLNYVGREESDKELIITNPKLIIRDKKYNTESEVKLGAELLFTKDDIARIVFDEHF